MSTSSKAVVMWIGVAVLVGCASPRGEAEDHPSQSAPAKTEAPANYMTGEVIVKFKPDVADAIAKATVNGQSLQSGIESLDRLFANYVIAKTERVFPTMPAGDPSGLANVYKLILPSKQAVEPAVKSFKADPHVVYAQPNYRAGVSMKPAQPGH